ncbi:MAG: class I SAM-dependent methyltransferase [Pirellulaceae bacterium]|nr:hypothetical protein [Planctomycetaceae bacterium]MDG1808416.1 class I SAM-dependent methyltransferase [Pirellulaceae bacterium]
MDELCIQDQVIQISLETRRRIAFLKANDPLRDWAVHEFDQLKVSADSPQLSLGESNARLSALKQLSHLVYEHCVRLQNSGFAEPIQFAPDSYLTVEARLPTNVLKTAREMHFSIAPTLLHNRQRQNDDFDPVSPTAKVVAYLRGMDKSLEIDGGFCPQTNGGQLLEDLGISDRDIQSLMAVLFQSRYHAINTAIGKNGTAAKQIVELAAGISPRGFQWSRMSPGTIYVESDLPQLMIHKAKLIRNSLLANPNPGRGMLHCCGANALDRDSIWETLVSLDKSKPFTLLTEGLLLYFDKEELAKFLQIVSLLLKSFPNAIWVTDFVTKENLADLLASHDGVAQGVRKVFGLTGRNVIPGNPFQTTECIHAALQRHWLSVDTTVRLADASRHLDLDRGISEELRASIVGDRKIWSIKTAG